MADQSLEMELQDLCRLPPRELDQQPITKIVHLGDADAVADLTPTDEEKKPKDTASVPFGQSVNRPHGEQLEAPIHSPSPDSSTLVTHPQDRTEPAAMSHPKNCRNDTTCRTYSLFSAVGNVRTGTLKVTIRRLPARTIQEPSSSETPST
ncbi:Uu.00g132260.m01.CDS01 [Anthostomella pinea]|uniref:Uu.00g132260.m01.CDS01 n=1 Tax=Anthostomella pinea TaxID=933095 RepID=A0AAI8VJ41_9PEZI|nr:Uu.00g132260.m01.CDS01 [Anthostomella pinea]